MSTAFSSSCSFPESDEVTERVATKNVNNFKEKSVRFSSTDVEEASNKTSDKADTTKNDDHSIVWWIKTVACIVLFISLSLSTVAISLFSPLFSIVTQPRETAIGDFATFGSTRIGQAEFSAIMEKYGIEYNYTDAVLGIESSTESLLLNLERINPGGVIQGFSYDKAWDLAKDLNTAAVEKGACKTVGGRQSHGLGSWGTLNDQKYECVPMTDTSKKNLLGALDLLQEGCKHDGLRVSTLFKHCMLLSPLRFSYYIAAGWATFDKQMDCEWDVQLIPWSSLHEHYNDTVVQDFAASFSSDVDTLLSAMDKHKIRCSTTKTKPALRKEIGFIATEHDVISQVWDYSEKVKMKRLCDSHNGTIVTSQAWEGDVMIGTFQMISFCRDTAGLANPTSCFDYFYDNFPPDSPGAKGFAPEENRAFAIETLELAWDGINPSDWAGRFAGFQDLCPGGLDPAGGYCWNAWRSVFGWGYDVSTVIGDRRWKVVSDALYRSRVLPKGTQHKQKRSCMDPSAGEVIVETEAPGQYRFAGVVYEVTPVLRLPNIIGFVVLLVIHIFADRFGDNRRHFFILGVFLLIASSSLWLFESAVSEKHIDTCEIRVRSIFQGNGVWFYQTFDRLIAGSLAISLCQGLLWILNPFVYNTGEIPSHIAAYMSIVGFAYASFVGSFGSLSREACSAYYGIHQADIYLPVFLGIFFTGFILIAYCKVPDSNSMAVLGLEKPPDGTKRVLYKKLKKFRLTDPRFGLSLFGHCIKPGPILLTLNYLEVDSSACLINEADASANQSLGGLESDKNPNVDTAVSSRNMSMSVSNTVRTIMESNDEELRGTPIEKVFESFDFVPDPWHVRLVKFLYEKDGIL